MRIGIDARLYYQTGVGRYIRNIVYHLGKIDSENEYIVYLRKQDINSVKLPNRRWIKRMVDIPWHTVSEQIRLPKLLLSDKLDVAHFTYFNVPVFYPKKYLLTIHDLIVDHFDTGKASRLPFLLYRMKRFGYKLAIFSGIKRAKALSAISVTTKQEIIEHYGVSEADIFVTYDALDSSFSSAVRDQKPSNYYDIPYILYVGNAYPHKNLERLIKAFKIIKKRSPDLKLVMAGDDNYFFPRLKKFSRDLGLGHEVIYFGNADDKQLINLYSFAKCLVFPSLMEGFGLPNLESVCCNCLPVVSDILAFREIWGNKLIYFNPKDTSDIAEKIVNVLSLSSKQYKMMIRHAKTRLDDFSWETTARKTLELYKEIIKN